MSIFISRSPGRTRRRRGLMGALGLGIALAGGLLTGCSNQQSTSTPSGSNAAGAVPATVTQAIAKYMKPTEWKPPGSDYDASPLKGKTVFFVIQGPGNPFLETVQANFQKAMSSVGINVVTCNGNYNPVEYARCVNLGVSQGAAGIQLSGVDASTIPAAIKAANDAGVPILGGDSLDASLPAPQGIAAQTSSAFILGAQLMADWIIADSGGSANALFITSPDVVGSVQEADSFKKTFAENCPKCKVTELGVTQAHWASDLGPSTTAALRKDPNIKYVVPSFDVMSVYTNPAMKLAGLNGKVKMVSSNASLDQMKQLANGEFFVAEVGQNVPGIGYIEADQLMRVLLKLEPAKNYIAPVRIFTRDTVKGLTLTQAAYDSGEWYGSSSQFLDAYAKHWSAK